MCRALKKTESDLKKQDAVAKARQKSSEIEMSIGEKPKISTLKFSIFRDKADCVLLGLTGPNSGPRGTRVYDLKPFYRGAKITVIGQ